MNLSIGIRAILLAGIVFALPFSNAAENSDDQRPAAGRLEGPGTRQAAPEIAGASDDGVQAMRRMKVPPGLEIKLWAAEPMLANPVAFNFDERGRMFVAETHRYRSSVLDIRNYLWMRDEDLACRTIEDRAALIRKAFGPTGEKELAIEGEIVRLLEDSDGDGVADRSRVYADGFNSPLDGIASGVLARRGAVYFTNIPSLWRFTGETRAETRTELSRGYGVRFNFTGHDLHGLIFGPDGKLYFSNGDRGATVRTKEGGVIDTADTGAVFRCHPDGTGLELVAWGLRNPQSLVFNEYGDLFTGENDCDNGDEERLVQVVEGGDSGWRVGYQFAPLGRAGPWNTERLWQPRHDGQPAYIVPPICNIEDGPSGIEYYPGTGLNPSYAGALFITIFKGTIARSGIYTYRLEPVGASYEVTGAEPFLSSALPTDVKFGPDGRLYLSDWVEGWPKSKRGRIYAIADPRHERDPLIQETQRLIGGDWSRRLPAELVKLLGHADWRVRLEAQFTLVERGAGSLPVLAGVATQSGSAPVARRHAIWGLGQLATVHASAFAPVRTILRDADAEVRAQAVKVLGHARGADDVGALIAALVDESPRVKFFAAQGLGKISAVQSGFAARVAPALFAALRSNNNEDAYVRHALVMGLVGGRRFEAMVDAINDPSPAVRLGSLLALRRLRRPEVAKFLTDTDLNVVREAALAINDEPIPEAMPALAALIDGAAGSAPRILADEPVVMRAINAHFRLGQPANAAALAAFAVRPDALPRLRAEALEQLALWPQPPARDRLVGVHRPLAEKTRDRDVAVKVLEPLLSGLIATDAPPVVRAAALKAVQLLEIRGASDALFAAMQDERHSADLRAAALRALDNLQDSRLAEAARFASASASSVLRLAALSIAARLSPEAALGVVSDLVSKGTITEQKAALRALGGLEHAGADDLITRQLEFLAAGKVAPEVQVELVTAAGHRSEPKVQELLAKREEALAASGDPLAPYRVALAGGDRASGQRTFLNQPVLACVRCHRAGADGGDAGPDLADVGARFTREYLLEAVVRPNAVIAHGFETMVVTLKSGAVAAGIVARETDDTLTLRAADDGLLELRKSEIVRRVGAPSGMPEIYGTILSKSELRDVVEYLASLKGSSARADDAKPRALRGRSG